MKKRIVGMALAILLCSACTSPEVENLSAPIELQEDARVTQTDDTQDMPQAVQSLEPLPLALDTYFGEADGTAIFLTSDALEYIYQQSMVDQQFSPYSTFKIVSTLIGLHEGIVTDKESTMAYDGTIYWYAPWNANLNLEQAFQNSCVWYYHQMVYQMAQQTVQEHLDALAYGNMDLSQWEGNGSNKQADLNGFWLNSSLKISPKEQVYLLKALFEGQTNYSTAHLDLLQTLMQTSEGNIYAKTGSGAGQAWYVGYFTENSQTVYFAVFMQGEDVSGAVAKQTAVAIVHDWSILADAVTS